MKWLAFSNTVSFYFYFFFHCTRGFTWADINVQYRVLIDSTVFPSGPSLICTVFVQYVCACMCVRACVCGSTTVRTVKVLGGGSSNPPSSCSTVFCSGQRVSVVWIKSGFHKNCNVCFIRKTIMWTLTSAVLLVNLSATMGIFTRLKFHRH